MSKFKYIFPKFKCEYCGSTDEVQFMADPYNAEINDDYTEHFICDNCAQESAWDI